MSGLAARLGPRPALASAAAGAAGVSLPGPRSRRTLAALLRRGRARAAEASPRLRPLALVATDDGALARSLRAELEGARCEVVAAASGEEALRLAERRRPHVVLLDSLLPGPGAFELTRLLREREAEAEAGFRILLLAERAADRRSSYAVAFGADDSFPRASAAAELRARLARLLAGR